MTREELFEFIERIDDPIQDYGKILSNFHYTHYFLIDKYKKLLAEYELTTAQSNVLGIIYWHKPNFVSLEEIQKMVLEPNSDVSRTVDRLQSKGFIEKIVDPSNRRRKSIRIMDKGVSTIEKIQADNRFRQLTAGVSLIEARGFVAFLKKLRSEKESNDVVSGLRD